jgi:hypothetical protein
MRDDVVFYGAVIVGVGVIVLHFIALILGVIV